jgi:peptidoglycan L-alanyl-D-glutamate endopeptidase CwlK
METTLQVGDSGPNVIALQQALAAANFSPGTIDGIFGNGTESALLAFQQSEGLTADGIAGPIVQKALGLDLNAPLPSSLPSSVADVTVQIVSQMFPQTPIGNIKTNLPFVLQAMTAANLGDKAMILMALSTIRAETAPFLPISEGQSRFNTSPNGTPFDLYDFRKDLGNQGPPDGANFRGRGFVQLTGRSNYTKYAAAIGQDIVNNFALANDPAVASQLLAAFLGDHQTAIRQALANNDLATARKLVNGGSNGLADFEDAFQKGSALIPDPAS